MEKLKKNELYGYGLTTLILFENEFALDFQQKIYDFQQKIKMQFPEDFLNNNEPLYKNISKIEITKALHATITAITRTKNYNNPNERLQILEEYKQIDYENLEKNILNICSKSNEFILELQEIKKVKNSTSVLALIRPFNSTDNNKKYTEFIQNVLESDLKNKDTRENKIPFYLHISLGNFKSEIDSEDKIDFLNNLLKNVKLPCIKACGMNLVLYRHRSLIDKVFEIEFSFEKNKEKKENKENNWKQFLENEVNLINNLVNYKSE